MQSNEIIRGTTPTIKYKFATFSVADIQVAYLTISQNDTVIIERDMSSATVGDTYISWNLTQEETLSAELGQAKVMCNWLLDTGVRGASSEVDIKFVKNQKEVVI